MSNTYSPFDAAENPQMHLAWQLINETGASLFLTGKAGTGKTTFLRRLRDASDKRIVVVAPTGIAAVNAGGVTIHSFFQLAVGAAPGDSPARGFDRFNRDKIRLIRTMDLLVIDEISMVRADLLDAVDTVLRRHRDPLRPFGGVQLLMIGDLQQLAPVVRDNEIATLRNLYETPYFFSSHALRKLSYNVITLEHTYRQQDPGFLRLLNSIRSGNPDASVLDALNRRVRPGFNPPESEGYIRLVTHNNQANDVNSRQLAMLPGRTYTFEAKVEGDFPPGGCNAETTLLLKEGAQVMFLRNDPAHDIYNGMIGHVVGFDGEIIRVQPVDAHNIIEVEPALWQNIKFSVGDDGNIRENVIGAFRQYPLRLAWAVTVHKSQGLTFNRAIIDVARSFAHGQTYVALSRCTTLEGIVLESPITRSAVIYDNTVIAYTRDCDIRRVTPQNMAQFRTSHYAATLADAFAMNALHNTYQQLYRAVSDYLGKNFPALTSQYSMLAESMQNEIAQVANTFISRARTRIMELPPDNIENGDDPYLSQRIIDAARYFSSKLAPFTELIRQTPDKCDNKAGTKRLQENLTAFNDSLSLTLSILDTLSRGLAFTPALYYRTKSQTLANLGANSQKNTSRRKQRPTKAAKSAKTPDNTHTRISAASSATQSRHDSKPDNQSGAPNTTYIPSIASADIQNPGLYSILTTWRAEKAKELHKPPYVIASTTALISAANASPSTPAELLSLPGWGPKTVAAYAAEILDLISANMP